MAGRRGLKNSLFALLAVLLLAGYLTFYALVRRERFEEAFMGNLAYTILYDENASHWIFLYSYYPVIWIDRKLLSHATEIISEERIVTWSNR